MFKSQLVIEDISGTKKWRLVEPLQWVSGVSWTVPSGFITDLSTLWFEGRHTRASVLHDYLLSQSVGRKYADDMMEEAMLTLGVKPWRRRLIMIGIRTKTIYRKVKL